MIYRFITILYWNLYRKGAKKRMKRLLIFSASTGEGHNQAAISLEELFSASEYKVMKLDGLRETSKILDYFITDGYKMLINNFPRAYSRLYRISDTKTGGYGVVNIITKLIQQRMYQLIKEYNPDLIITTHAFLVNVIGKLKEKERIDIPLMSVVTDFKVHQTYIHKWVDAYITGSRYTKFSIVKKQIPKEKIFCFGIPIKEEFMLYPFDQRKKKERIFTILLMGGSTGFKPMEKVLKELVNSENKLKIIVVCGRDNELKKSIDKKYREGFNNKKIIVYGFTKNISELMDKSDVIITKPGGLTVSESIAKNIPMIIPYTLPGQEEENAEFLVQSRAAIRTEKIENITNTIDGLVDNPYLLKNMRQRMKELSEIYSMESIVELADKLILKKEYGGKKKQGIS